MAFFWGTNGGDTFTGTAGRDFITGRRGDDILDGDAGNDFVAGGRGADTVTGGAGNDIVLGDGAFRAFWWLESHDDFVDGGAGNDLVFGGYGDDSARYGVTENLGAQDFYDGGRGADTLILDMDLADWMRDDVQADIAGFLAFLATNSSQVFQFGAFGLDVRRFEDLQIIVDGVELTPEDDPVTANDDSFTVGEDDGDTAFGTVLSNDVVPDLVYEVALVSGPAAGVLTFNPGTPGAPDGSFSFDPNGEFEYLNAGETAEVTFTYEVTDANGDTDQATVTITIEGADDGPVANDDAITTDENTGVTVDVLANDSGTGLTLDGINVVSGLGTASIVGGEILWEPGSAYDDLAEGDTVQVVIGYDMSDSTGNTESAELTITVEGRNDTPLAPLTTVIANEDDNAGLITIDLNGFVSDIDTGDTLTISNIQGNLTVPFTDLGGGLIQVDTTTLGIELNDGDILSTRFTYTVTDDSGAANDSAVGTVNLTINGVSDFPTEPEPEVNTAPVATDFAVAGDEAGGAILIDISDLGTDADGDPLILTAITDAGGDTVAFTQIGTTISIDPTQFFPDGGVSEVPGTGFWLAEGEQAVLALDFTIQDDSGDTGNDSDTGVITLTLTGDTPTNAAPTAQNILTPPGGTPNIDPFSGQVIPSDVIVGEIGAAALVIDLDDFTSDPDGGPNPLTFSFGGLEIGIDEVTGLPITSSFSFDTLTNELSITLDETFNLADGESAVGTLVYTVSDGLDEASGTITFNFVNPDTTPPSPDNQVLDFEPFSDEFGASISLDTLNPSANDNTGQTYEGFLFQGVASVIETDELGGGRGAEPGLVNGQTTDPGDNVLLGQSSTTTVDVPVLDETGQPVLVPQLDARGNPVVDEGGNPVLVPQTTTETLIDDFAMLAPGSTFGIGGDGVSVAFGIPAGLDLSLQVQATIDSYAADAFSLDGLSLNVVGGDNVTVTVTTYRLGEVRVPNAFNPTSDDVFVQLVEAETFEFVVSESTPATELDFNALGFADDGTVPNTNTAGFDDIYAVSFTTSDDSLVVLDDIYVTL
ncbi:MAG: hypothetical protein GJ677_02535 [Rhodobacteraceae bacterium]|nr:hypothetical protein [Paracoccaceae bacterium]